MSKSILYVNGSFQNDVTLDITMQEEIDSFGVMTWRKLLVDLLHEDLKNLNEEELQEALEDGYGITPNQLDELIDGKTIEKYYATIAYDVDNREGAGADAFDLLRDLELFPMDRDGNGAANGVALEQTTQDGPRKCAWIEDEAAARWLRKQFKSRGLEIKIKFV